MIQSSSRQHLGIHLDKELNFFLHIKEKISKANKGVGAIKKLNNTLPRKALLTLYLLSGPTWIMGIPYI